MALIYCLSIDIDLKEIIHSSKEGIEVKLEIENFDILAKINHSEDMIFLYSLDLIQNKAIKNIFCGQLP